MPASHTTRQAAGQLAAATRHHPDQTEALEQLRAEMVRLRLVDAVNTAIAAAPPIPPERVLEIAELLIVGMIPGADKVAS